MSAALESSVVEAIRDAILNADPSNPVWRGLLLDGILAALSNPGTPPQGDSAGPTAADLEASQALLDKLHALLRAQGADAPDRLIQSDGEIVEAFMAFRLALRRKCYPPQMSPALASVLGMAPFQLTPIWLALREVGQEIGHRYEAEVAAALHFLVPIAIEHGDNWRRAAADKLLDLRAAHEART